MADITIYEKYLKVTNGDSSIAVNDYFVKVRCETSQTIETGDTVLDISPEGLPELPKTGEWVEKNKLYNYNSETVHCLQGHFRTIYSPDITPALFAFYRENSDELEWIIGEKVLLDWIRIYDGENYECIQAHITQAGWEPNITPALWQKKTEGCLPWVQPTGAHDAYNIDDCITFEGNEYISLINANVWSPSVYPAGWQLQ